jgi:hypothetical protein
VFIGAWHSIVHIIHMCRLHEISLGLCRSVYLQVAYPVCAYIPVCQCVCREHFLVSATPAPPSTKITLPPCSSGVKPWYTKAQCMRLARIHSSSRVGAPVTYYEWSYFFCFDFPIFSSIPIARIWMVIWPQVQVECSNTSGTLLDDNSYVVFPTKCPALVCA